MPKKYGVKEKDQAVTHIMTLIMTGRLRSGDRVDRNAIAQELGMSRVPIQEAVLQLEHDGVLTTRYHRGAFVARFDEFTVREHHELYGVLSGIASARAAADPQRRIVGHLEELRAALQDADSPQQVQDIALAYRNCIVGEYAGPRLAAAIHAYRNVVPADIAALYLHHHDRLLPALAAEHAAIVAGDADAAREACVVRMALLTDIMVDELRRRGVLPAQEAARRA
ncbi:GntR family transcriptional regulator [Mycobacterium sp. MYCO198283]|uniref:GntR family transcriptional regulator n=1 Tax=Mycobacterium sp. MYCO198283 TaxID=2883505 RepID=UPI001E2A8DE7|nr:GntR family transcriptional regulator [Mycobacterium sp. MYCO198283]MCG5434113.1 GntR family transcriptional regulator [Mycobacterium sp. MYCO198283]